MEKTYDPNKNYQWDAEDEFILKGKEVEAISLLVRVLQSEPEYKKFLLIQKTSTFIENLFKRNANVLEEIQPQNEATVREMESTG